MEQPQYRLTKFCSQHKSKDKENGALTGNDIWIGISPGVLCSDWVTKGVAHLLTAAVQYLFVLCVYSFSRGFREKLSFLKVKEGCVKLGKDNDTGFIFILSSPNVHDV